MGIFQWLGRVFGVTQVRAKHDAAQTTPENRRHWQNADALSADASASAVVRKTIRERARYEIANNPLLAGMVATKADLIIGSGPRLRMLTDSPEVNARVERLFAEWANETGLASTLTVMAKAKVGDGEEFGIIRIDEAVRHPVKIRLRDFECDRCATPGFTVGEVDGIEFDAYGNPAAYSILREHPGSTNAAFAMTADKVPAEFVLHGFTQTRPEQSRGISELSPALGLVAILRRYITAMTLAAELGASMPVVIESELPPDSDGATGLNDFDSFEFERNMMTTLPHGYKAKAFETGQPQAEADQFIRRIVSLIARCLKMPYNIAAADSSQHNFASGRLDNYGFYRDVAIERAARNRNLDKLFRVWLTFARVADPSLDGLGLDARHEWLWDSVETSGDPVAEATAIEIKLRTKQTTLAKVYADSGQDWEDAQKQLAEEARVQRVIAPPVFTGDHARSAVEVLTAVSEGRASKDAAEILLAKLGLDETQAAKAVANITRVSNEEAA
ncbi:MAG: phage portal protein [Phycisphaerales bacterium]|nr:phage portal protein [Phycisphaerales bacterium]